MASTGSSIINLTKTIVGAGLLAIPFAFKADGVVFGVFLVLLAAVTSGYGLYIVGEVSSKLNGRETSFFALCSITYPKLSLLFDFSIFLQTFGVGISYLILFGDLLPSLINDALSRNQVIVLSLLIIVPLISLKKLDSLKYGSIVGLIAIGYLVLLVIYHVLTDDLHESKGVVEIWPNFNNFGPILSTFSIIIFAFTAAQNICTIINEIHSVPKVNFVIYSSIGISTLLFLLVGLSGYIQFGDTVGGNVILMYDPALKSSKFGKFALVLMVALSYPLMFHPCRISVNNMVHWVEVEYVREKNNDLDPLLNNEDNLTRVEIPFSQNRFVILTVLLTVASYGLAISVKSFELVLALIGATGSTLICFILPGLFGFKLFDDKLNKVLSLSLTVWGIIIMITSVYATLYL